MELRSFAHLCGGFAVIAGVLILFGWAFDVIALTSLLPGFPAAQPMTALAMCLSGIALALHDGRRATRLVAAILAAVVIGLCLLTFLTYSGLDLGKDQWLFPSRLVPQSGSYPHPGRMAELTAVCFLLASFAIAAKALNHVLRLAAATATLALLLALLAALAYAFSMAPLYSVLLGGFAAMSLPTATVLTVLAIGVLFLGLFINELQTNAYKYAYPEGEVGGVHVFGIREADDRYRLEVSDAGRGLPSDFNLAGTRERLGIRVITSLAAQLGGELTAGSADPGARFTLVFPLRAAESK